jgi:hypothetical protein
MVDLDAVFEVEDVDAAETDTPSGVAPAATASTI